MFFFWPFVAPRMISLPSLRSVASPTTYMSVEAPGWNYAPLTEWGQGDLITENRIRREVATPGRELGIINEALSAVILALESTKALDDLPKEDQAAIARFKTMVQMIKPIIDEERTKRLQGMRDIPAS